MNDKEIVEILLHHPVTANFFRACCGVDQLCGARKLHVAGTFNIYICNTTPSMSSKMGHWLLIVLQPYGTGSSCDFFDSFGRDVSQFDTRIFKFIHGFKPLRVNFNPSKLQMDGSCVCGLWVIFMAVYICAGYSMPSILKWFSKTDQQLNDLSLYQHMKKQVKSGLPNGDYLLTCNTKRRHSQVTGSYGPEAKQKWMSVLGPCL